MCAHEVVRFGWGRLWCVDCDQKVQMLTPEEIRLRADEMDRAGPPGAARRMQETARHVETNVRLGL